MINYNDDEDCDHNEDNDDDGDDFDDGDDERSEKLLVSNRQSTFDRQLDSGHLGRFGSQVGYFEINYRYFKDNSINSMKLNGDSKIMHNTMATLWKVTNVLDKSRRLCLRSWSLLGQR